MKNFIISPIAKKIIVRFSNKCVILPLDIQDKVDAYWDELIKSGKNYKRGEVFTVTKKEEFEDRIDILVEKTDYAHYLYCQNIDALGENGVHIIHTAALVETSDEKIIFGKMGNQTSRSEIHQLCGGGIDNNDLRDDIFDLNHNIKKELEEELGINIDDSKRIETFGLAYFKEGGPTNKMTVTYKVKLNETSEEFMEKYNEFVLYLKKNNKLPEFGDIIILNKDKKSLNDFFNKNDIRLDEYMRPLFEYISKHSF
ncbi:MAG TPA: hypothetical protein DEA43_01935 [Candidatus Moranbacteria bacterium]|nr:hypothetical protein [Candidatus Moranbacteria bacterium]HBT45628.1 hypothetical protein [Candidatus Moranbacteria bacterium]